MNVARPRIAFDKVGLYKTMRWTRLRCAGLSSAVGYQFAALRYSSVPSAVPSGRPPFKSHLTHLDSLDRSSVALRLSTVRRTRRQTCIDMLAAATRECNV